MNLRKESLWTGKPKISPFSLKKIINPYAFDNHWLYLDCISISNLILHAEWRNN